MIALGAVIGLYLLFNSSLLQSPVSAGQIICQETELDEFEEEEGIDHTRDGRCISNKPSNHMLLALPLWSALVLLRVLVIIVASMSTAGGSIQSGIMNFSSSSLVQKLMTILSLFQSGLRDIQFFFFFLILAASLMTVPSITPSLSSYLGTQELIIVAVISVFFLIYKLIMKSSDTIEVYATTAALFLREQPRVRGNLETRRFSANSEAEVPKTEGVKLPTDGRSKSAEEIKEAIASICLSKMPTREAEKLIEKDWHKIQKSLLLKSSYKVECFSIEEEGSVKQYFWAPQDPKSKITRRTA